MNCKRPKRFGRYYFMKYSIYILLIWGIASSFIPSTWTPTQLAKANTAKEVKFLSRQEKEVVKYINLARLYPSDFSAFEVENYMGTPKYGDYVKKSLYKKSLLKRLKSQKSLLALKATKALSKSAQCFAKEQGKSGYVGHNRKKCEREGRGECCSYGMSKGKDIAMQFLIDHNVPGEGHREMIFMDAFSLIGVGTYSHSVHGNCAVVEFK